jgi:hypothetical protein
MNVSEFETSKALTGKLGIESEFVWLDVMVKQFVVKRTDTRTESNIIADAMA